MMIKVNSVINSIFSRILFISLLACSLVSAEDDISKTETEELKPKIGRFGEDVAVDSNEYEFSIAEKKLWLTDHLKNIDKPVRLFYEFDKSGTLEEGFTDSVFLDINQINKNGSKNANLSFFTGVREQRIATDENLTDITGNPVLGVYLHGDVSEMNRLTEGSWRYFQRRVKLALSEDAVIEPVTVDFNGKSVSAEKITLQPYINDPKKARYEKYSGKIYEFIFSDEIPGALYQIHTSIPDLENPANAALIEETLTLKQVNYRK